MSGGVDSAVAALLLLEKRYRITGITMELKPATFGEMRTAQHSTAVLEAQALCSFLGIPHVVVDMSCQFSSEIIDYFCASYLEGSTPNPCVHCNTRIKFGSLLDLALSMGFERLATGHYAITAKDPDTGRHTLSKGADLAKDQSYFLHALSQRQLEKAVFPIGRLSKEDVRRIAAEQGLPVGKGRESRDACFLEGQTVGDFIARRSGRIVPNGEIVDSDGSVVGTHKGITYYTVGQRRGLGVSFPHPVFISRIDPFSNRVTVVSEKELHSVRTLELEGVNYVSVSPPRNPLQARVKTRYSIEELPAMIVPGPDNTASVRFESLQPPTAPGQSVVAYSQDLLLCGGTVIPHHQFR